MGAHTATRGGRHRAPGRRPLLRGRHARRSERGRLLLVGVGAVLAAGWSAFFPLSPEDPTASASVPAAAPVTLTVPKPPPPPPPTRPSQEPGLVAARAALSKRGTWYLWGGKGPNNFDCSGLAQWAWRQAGVSIGPDTYTQVKQGDPVDYGEPVRPGDLIFPTASFDSRGPHHMMLAVSATEVVEAPGRGMRVRTAPLPDSYVARRPK